jgi:hypothetical protein
MAGDLQSIARSWSQHMASGHCSGSDSICHNPSLTSQVHNWRVVGENVGVGPGVSDIETAFMNSSPHRANILDSDYTEVGIGTAVGKDGRVYVTQDFRRPMTTSSSSSSPKRHHSTAKPVHHASTPAHHSSAPAPALPRSVAPAVPSGRDPVVAPAAPAHTSKSQPLAARLRAANNARTSGADPVGQAVSFVSTMGVLTG